MIRGVMVRGCARRNQLQIVDDLVRTTEVMNERRRSIGNRDPPRNIIGDWRTWESDSGRKVVRVGPGSTMFVPPGCPHAFANPGPAPVRMLLHVTPPGHEVYLQELADLLSRGGPPDPNAIAELRARHDIEQLTSLGGDPAGR
jgi:hypothetical protein